MVNRSLHGSSGDPKQQFFVLDEHTQQPAQEEAEQQQRRRQRRRQGKESADAIWTLARKGPKLSRDTR
jgi:hypothetical protein